MAKEKGVKGVFIFLGNVILYAGLVGGSHWLADNASEKIELSFNRYGYTQTILQPVTQEQQVADFFYHITPQPIFTGVIDYINSARIDSDNTYANEYITSRLQAGAIRHK